NPDVPPYKIGFLAVMRRLNRAGVAELNGHLLYAVPEDAYAAADAWLERSGLVPAIDRAAEQHAGDPEATLDAALEPCFTAGEAAAGLGTLGEAVADAMAARAEEGIELEMTIDEWRQFAATASWHAARAAARRM